MQRAYTDRMILSEAIEAVGKLLTAYPNGGAQAGKSYIGTIASVLLQYPRSIALRCAHPVNGVPRKSEFMPTVATVVAWCEAEAQAMWNVVANERREEAQLRDRQEQEALSDYNPDVLDRVRKAMRKAGMPIMGDKRNEAAYSVAAAKEKLGLSDAQWNAIPDAPPDSTWAKVGKVLD